MPLSPPTHKPLGSLTESERKRLSERFRGSRHARGYTSKWDRERLRFLAKFPLCASHAEKQMVVAATVVDHKIPHRGDEKLFWDRKNWQSLCATCHNAKTAREDGGFGNGRMRAVGEARERRITIA